MNRAIRRALSRPHGRADLERELLRNENAELRAQIQGLTESVRDLAGKHDQLPGVVEGRKDWFVLVGGQRVELKAIPPAEWIRTLEELPAFLFTFAVERTTNPAQAPNNEALEQITDLAKRWLSVTAVDPSAMNLDHLTLPEAEHAVAHISELNGVTAALRTWFRQRLAGLAAGAPGRAPVRGQAQQPPGDLAN